MSGVAGKVMVDGKHGLDLCTGDGVNVGEVKEWWICSGKVCSGGDSCD